MKLKCFNEKNQHIGNLVVLDRTASGPNDNAVTKWCPLCGAVVVDHENDNRVVGQYSPMRFSQITRNCLKGIIS